MKKHGKTAGKGKKATAAKDLSVRSAKGRAVRGGEANNPITQAPSQRLIPSTTGGSPPPLRQSPIPGGVPRG
jgi:hypothetical protein